MTNVRRWLRAAGIVMGFLGLAIGLAQAQTKTIAERLGYPADAKLVILHADDLAVAHSVDMASFAALDQKAVSSASIMVPCPWLTEVAAYAKAHPDADLGLHLTLNSEWKNYRWGPVAPKDQVQSLLDSDGYFYGGVPEAATHIRPEEAEREIRAQIDLALKMGIHPTHLDMHMGTLAATPQLYATLVKVGHEYHLPFLAVHVNDARNAMVSLLAPGDVILDSLVMFDSRVPAGQWTESYVKALAAIKPGIHYLIVHLGHDDAELQAVTVDHPDYGAAWRQRDFNAVTSPEFKRALEENHIILVGWKDLKKIAD
jgi:chitin disaccharide deacetylase